MVLARASNAAEGRRIPYVGMPGSPFTGSTLLGMHLNNHPDCASIGAATGLIAKVDLSTYRCSCGRLFRECEFWKDIQARTRALGHPVDVFQTNHWNTYLRLSDNRALNAVLIRSLRSGTLNAARDAVIWRAPKVRAAISEMGWNTWSLAAAVLQRTGKRVFVDTARDHQRPKYLASHPLLDVKVIHLIRDPRGNTASIMKHQGVDVARAARLWKQYNVEAARVRRYFPPDSWLSLHYEELCADPLGVFARISDFLGIERSTAQDGSGNREHHLIGNSRRLEGLAEIREDLSWQTRLSNAELALLARIAGPVSHRLGYQWP